MNMHKTIDQLYMTLITEKNDKQSKSKRQKTSGFSQNKLQKTTHKFWGDQKKILLFFFFFATKFCLFVDQIGQELSNTS